MFSYSKRTVTSISPIPTDSLCLKHAQCLKLEIWRFLWRWQTDRQTDRKTDCFTPCAYPRGSNVLEHAGMCYLHTATRYMYHKPHVIMIFMADKHSLAICQLYTVTLYLHSWIKLGLCSSKWDQIWNVDSRWHALDCNGEFFLNTCILPAKTMMSYVKNQTCQHSTGKTLC